MKIVLLGPPGAGKGSLAALIKDHFKIWHISTGDILREEISKVSPLAAEIKSYIEYGNLVPDTLITKIVDQKLTYGLRPEEGFMLDGYPRTAAQAEDLDKILKKTGSSLDLVLDLETSLNLIVKRITGRRICRKCRAVYHISNHPPKVANICDTCQGALHQRADDNEETVKTRMEIYAHTTAPILDYYRKHDKLHTIDGDEETLVLFQEFVQFVNENKEFHKN